MKTPGFRETEACCDSPHLWSQHIGDWHGRMGREERRRRSKGDYKGGQSRWKMITALLTPRLYSQEKKFTSFTDQCFARIFHSNIVYIARQLKHKPHWKLQTDRRVRLGPEPQWQGGQGWPCNSSSHKDSWFPFLQCSEDQHPVGKLIILLPSTLNLLFHRAPG